MLTDFFLFGMLPPLTGSSKSSVNQKAIIMVVVGAFFLSFLNLCAQRSQEAPNDIYSEILDMSVVVLAVAVIFPTSSRWTYWIINMRSTSTDDVIRLASLRHQLCILDACQSRFLPFPCARLDPTGPRIACQICGES